MQKLNINIQGGMVIMKASIRSSIPPCPGIKLPESLTPA